MSIQLQLRAHATRLHGWLRRWAIRIGLVRVENTPVEAAQRFFDAWASEDWPHMAAQTSLTWQCALTGSVKEALDEFPPLEEGRAVMEMPVDGPDDEALVFFVGTAVLDGETLSGSGYVRMVRELDPGAEVGVWRVDPVHVWPAEAEE